MINRPDKAIVSSGFQLGFAAIQSVYAPYQRSTHMPKPTALATFLARKAEIDTMLARLTALSDEHFGYGPEAINWGHVGTLEHYAKLLRQITESAFREAEHGS
jgi:hypothetical protein